jgi:DNA polymerase-3 subunit delta'
MQLFAHARELDHAEQRVALAAGSPGAALALDLDAYAKRRSAMLVLLRAAAGVAPFSSWTPVAETMGRGRGEKLEAQLKILYELLRDVLLLQQGGGEPRNADIRGELEAIARKVDYPWIRKAVVKTDEILDLGRRNIQKGIALDALIAELRTAV